MSINPVFRDFKYETLDTMWKTTSTFKNSTIFSVDNDTWSSVVYQERKILSTALTLQQPLKPTLSHPRTARNTRSNCPTAIDKHYFNYTIARLIFWLLYLEIRSMDYGRFWSREWHLVPLSTEFFDQSLLLSYLFCSYLSLLHMLPCTLFACVSGTTIPILAGCLIATEAKLMAAYCSRGVTMLLASLGSLQTLESAFRWHW